MKDIMSTAEKADIHSIQNIADELGNATHFEQACEALLKAILDYIEQHFWEGPYAAEAHVRRGMIHRRASQGYESLVVLDRHSNQPEWLKPSTTAWKYIDRSGGTISIDITTGEVYSRSQDQVLTERYTEQTLPPDTENARSETQYHLLERDTTHLLAIPFDRQGNRFNGMISIEATCRPGIGSHDLWRNNQQHCELLTRLSVPWILSKPRAITRHSNTPQALLPVAGSRIRQMMTFIQAFASQRETLLISGPSGSGKTRLAQSCHLASPMKEGPFEVVDLLAIPDDMQMAELTGWTRGAFTGAVQDHKGALERAEGGTLLIDEIDKLSLKAQAGLLQILETRQYRRLGGSGATRAANVRMIVGTNCDLAEAVRQKQFREDLFYRINVLPIELPGMDERRDEIGEWANFMAERCHQERNGSGRCHVAIDATTVLTNRAWPGNLRQLDNVIRRAYSMAVSGLESDTDVTIHLSDVNLALQMDGSRAQSNLFNAMLEAASAFVDEAMSRNQGGVQLKIEHCSAFTGLVLQQALNRLKTRKAVYLLFGRESQIENRNYNREINRELERLRALFEVLDIEDHDQLLNSLHSSE